MTSVGNWKGDVCRWWDQGLHLDAFARKLPGEWRTDWICGGLQWGAWGGTLHDFTERVRIVAKALGPPDSVKGEPNANGVVDMEARWKIDVPHRMSHKDGGVKGATIRVTARPRNCRIIKTETVEHRSDEDLARLRDSVRVERKLHPECQHALAELEG